MAEAGNLQVRIKRQQLIQAQGLEEARQAEKLNELEQLKNAAPVMLQTVSIPVEKDLQEPSADLLSTAYEENQLEMPSTKVKRNSRLESSKEKFQLQEKLKGKKILAKKGGKIPYQDAKKLDDEKLVRDYETLPVNDSYLSLRYELISNRYFALLPRKQMQKLSREQLVSRLKEQYGKEKNERQEDLIAYYQTMIRLKDYEEEQEGKEEGEKEEEKEERKEGLSKEEKKKNLKALENNQKAFQNSYLSGEEIQKRTAAMRKVLLKEEDDEKQEEKGSITEEQKEGIRAILAWMY
ncbi:MAG: hypothetical protein IJU50_01605, partial [Lachnospiraceae bacterium]|nr:hypothetical protein [Lachnospiraceae bacterium]